MDVSEVAELDPDKIWQIHQDADDLNKKTAALKRACKAAIYQKAGRDPKDPGTTTYEGLKLVVGQSYSFKDQDAAFQTFLMLKDDANVPTGLLKSEIKVSGTVFKKMKEGDLKDMIAEMIEKKPTTAAVQEIKQ